jgi:hypothetical protein
MNIQEAIIFLDSAVGNPTKGPPEEKCSCM